MRLFRTLHAAMIVAAGLTLAGCGTIDTIKNLWSGGDLEDGVGERQEEPRVQVLITGVEDELADNVRAMLIIATEACDAPGWRVEREFSRSDEDVRRALRALGHYKPDIEKFLKNEEECWQASYQIEPGPRAVFGNIDIAIDGEAFTDKRFVELLAKPPVSSGEPLDHGRYEGLKRTIESLAAERGYFDGAFTQRELLVDVEAGRADVRLRYDSGKRYKLGEIAVQQSAYNEDLIARLTRLKPGQPYDSTALAAQNRDFSDSGYFGSVDISPQLREARRRAARADAGEDALAPSSDESAASTETEDHGPRSVPVEISLTPRPKHSYSGGVGFATDVGPRLRLGYENRRVNRSGHRWNADTTLSLRESDINFGYKVPLADPRSEWLTFQAGYKIENKKTFESSTTRVGVDKTGSRYGWLETQSFDITHDTFTIAERQSTALLLVPGISWQKVSGDDPFRPTRGWSALLELRGTHEALLSDTSFVQTRVRTTGVYQLPWEDRLLGRVEMGATAVTDFDVLPPDYRFFAGGDNSIRGYGFEELGPKDAADHVVGGRYLMVGSLEYEHRLTDTWSVATFVDAGNAYDKFDEGIKIGVGAGVRWQTPVGPLRLDVGIPLDDDDTLFRLHIRFGPDL